MEEQPKPPRLTAKEKAWAEAWLVTLSKAEAARRAKYKGDNVQLANIGWQNYRKPHIQAYLKDRLAEMVMPANEVLRRLTDMASGSVSDFADIKSSAGLVETEQGHIVKKFKKTTTRTAYGSEVEAVELELYDAQAALVHLGKIHGLFTDKVEHSGMIESKLIILPPKEANE